MAQRLSERQHENQNQRDNNTQQTQQRRKQTQRKRKQDQRQQKNRFHSYMLRSNRERKKSRTPAGETRLGREACFRKLHSRKLLNLRQKIFPNREAPAKQAAEITKAGFEIESLTLTCNT